MSGCKSHNGDSCRSRFVVDAIFICFSCTQDASPEVSEETVNCSRKTADAVSVDMLCEESVCSADDDADARPDKKQRRTGVAASVCSQLLAPHVLQQHADTDSRLMLLSFWRERAQDTLAAPRPCGAHVHQYAKQVDVTVTAALH